MGLGSVWMGLGFSYGFCSIFGLAFGPLHNLIPFLLLGIGILKHDTLVTALFAERYGFFIKFFAFIFIKLRVLQNIAIDFKGRIGFVFRYRRYVCDCSMLP